LSSSARDADDADDARAYPWRHASARSGSVQGTGVSYGGNVSFTCPAGPYLSPSSRLSRETYLAAHWKAALGHRGGKAPGDLGAAAALMSSNGGSGGVLRLRSYEDAVDVLAPARYDARRPCNDLMARHQRLWADKLLREPRGRFPCSRGVLGVVVKRNAPLSLL
jgi:hypothetical protein